MREYKHTQIGYLHASVSCFLILIMIYSEFAVKANKYTVIAVAICVGVLLVFSKLTTRVAEGVIEARFGVGIICKRFQLSEVKSYEKVRNPWYFGIGIRYTPRGWLYNIYGRSAIELVMKDGKRCRIGTDDPDGFERAIYRALYDLAE